MRYKGFYDDSYKHIGFVDENDDRILSDNFVEFSESEMMEVFSKTNGTFIYDKDTPDDLSKIKPYESEVIITEEMQKMIDEGGKQIEKQKAMDVLTKIQVETIALTLAPEQQEELKALFDDWSGASVEYKVDKRVVYNNVLYKVITKHTSQSDWTPINAPSLFAKVLTDPSGAPKEWVQPGSTNPYMKGDKVLYQGKTYESTIDNNVWSPTAYPQGWKVVM